MFKLLPIIFTVIVISVANSASLQLVVPKEYIILSSGKSSQTAISPPLPPQQTNDVSPDENSNDENSDDGSEQTASAPASVTRFTETNSSSSSTSDFSTSTDSSGSSSIGRATGSRNKIAPSIQHHVLLPGTVLAPETITIRERTVAKVGEVVQKIPTAVSHQSQTIVHKHARVVTPILAPATRTITSQVVRAYPLVYGTSHGPTVVRVLHHN